MPRIRKRVYKIPISISLDRDVILTLRKVAKHWGVSQSAVAQQAIVFLAAQPGNLPDAQTPEANKQ